MHTNRASVTTPIIRVQPPSLRSLDTQKLRFVVTVRVNVGRRVRTGRTMMDDRYAESLKLMRDVALANRNEHEKWSRWDARCITVEPLSFCFAMCSQRPDLRQLKVWVCGCPISCWPLRPSESHSNGPKAMGSDGSSILGKKISGEASLTELIFSQLGLTQRRMLS